MNTFKGLGIPEQLESALAARGITVPTAVQSKVIPLLLSGKNVVFQSETGTGKTFAYLLPALMACGTETETPKVLIIAPTHELASQIKSESLNLAKDAAIRVKTALLIGGAPISRQLDTLKEKPAIVVGGPSRLLELIRLKKLKISRVRLVVLDETDRMLAPEMRDSLRELLSVMPGETQFAACSATISKYHASLLEKMLPTAKRDVASDDGVTQDGVAHGGGASAGAKYRITLVNLPSVDVLTRNIEHWAFYAEGRDKIETLRKFLIAEKPGKTLVFTAIAGQVENIVAQLNHRNVDCAGIHAKLDKVGRKKALDDFRSGRSKVLVTSDLSARGLDIPGITHVIQLDVNENEDFFVHRAGRTARAGKSGINVVFGDEREMRALARMEKKLGIVVYPKVLYGGVVRTPEQDGPSGEGVNAGGDDYDESPAR
jgi:ATP-dependent RNA helicase DeaD